MTENTGESRHIVTAVIVSLFLCASNCVVASNGRISVYPEHAISLRRTPATADDNHDLPLAAEFLKVPDVTDSILPIVSVLIHPERIRQATKRPAVLLQGRGSPETLQSSIALDGSSMTAHSPDPPAISIL